MGLVRGSSSVRDLEGLMGAVVVVSRGASMGVLGGGNADTPGSKSKTHARGRHQRSVNKTRAREPSLPVQKRKRRTLVEMLPRVPKIIKSSLIYM